MAKQKIKVIREEMLQVANNVAEEKNISKDGSIKIKDSSTKISKKKQIK